jgi:hypothetical protein
MKAQRNIVPQSGDLFTAPGVEAFYVIQQIMWLGRGGLRQINCMYGIGSILRVPDGKLFILCF